MDTGLSGEWQNRVLPVRVYLELCRRVMVSRIADMCGARGVSPSTASLLSIVTAVMCFHARRTASSCVGQGFSDIGACEQGLLTSTWNAFKTQASSQCWDVLKLHLSLHSFQI